jgi:hypothetical protein
MSDSNLATADPRMFLAIPYCRGLDLKTVGEESFSNGSSERGAK